jgi:hypothetical protein
VHRLAALILLAASLLPAATAHAGARMEVAVQDDGVLLDQYWYGRAAGLGRAQQLNVTWIRSNLVWSRALARGQANRRTRPRHLRWSFSHWDGLIDDAAARGIRVELTLTGPSPAFATSTHKAGPDAPRIAAWREFVRAAARHFKGRVSRYTIWNEPNYVGWLRPAREAPYIYRGLYKAAWRELHRVDPRAQVLIGETSPYAIRGKAWAPLTFIRATACVDGRYRRLKGCHGSLIADGYAQHPYNYENPPTYRYPGADNVTIGTLSRLTRALDRLRRAHALRTRRGGKMGVFLTEFGYFTFGYRRQPESRRARYERQAFAIAQRNPRVRQMTHYQLVEPPKGPYSFWKTYLILQDGRPRFTFWSLASWARGAAAARRILVPAKAVALPAAPRRR